MTAERCMCGATDCPRCYPETWNSLEPTERHYELALEEIVECVLNHGQWPMKGRPKFDLYDFILEHRDTSFLVEMYVASLSSNFASGRRVEDKLERERRNVEELLIAHLRDSDIVQDLAEENAADEAE